MAFELKTESYSGPLDALLNLIEERKLSISNVNLADVTDAYLSYVEKLPELPLGETAQFILVASTLLLIKSRTLLPTVDLTAEESQSIEELERRLVRYGIIRKASKLLRHTWGSAQLFFPQKSPSAWLLSGVRPTCKPGHTTVAMLLSALQRVLGALPRPDTIAEASVAPVLALEEVIAQLRARLGSSIRATWSALTKETNRSELIVHFLAILELVRSGSVSATQDRLFSDILLETETLNVPRY